MKRKIELFAALACSVLLILGFFYLEEYAKSRKQIPTTGITLEAVGDIGDFWITVPAAENGGLSCDINGVSFEDDNTIYLILPKDVNDGELVYYLRDTYNNHVTRVVSNFNDGEVIIADRKIEAVKSELPIMFIEGNDDYGTFQELLKAEDKQTYFYGDMYLSVSKEDARKNNWVTSFATKEYNKDIPETMSLHARGNGTWAGGRKKPFALRLERAEDLLGMGKNKKWNLLANSQDKTLLRNDVFFQLAQNIGMEFVPQAENVVLYVDGNYQGVYLLTTKVAVDKNRVNLSVGDFLINWGAPNPAQILYYDSDTWFMDSEIPKPHAELVWPEEDTDLDSKQEIIQKFISTIENTKSSEYLNYMDMKSMVQYYWVQEISMNYDAFFRSTYSYYRQKTGKLYMGPIWDMDLTLGTIKPKLGVSFSEPEGWKVRQLSWYAPLFEHEEFREAVREAYFEGGIRDEMLRLIDVMEAEKERLSVDGEMNFRYWTNEIVQNTLQYDDKTYVGQTDEVIDFYRKRIEWIDEQMKLDE